MWWWIKLKNHTLDILHCVPKLTNVHCVPKPGVFKTLLFVKMCCICCALALKWSNNVTLINIISLYLGQHVCLIASVPHPGVYLWPLHADCAGWTLPELSQTHRELHQGVCLSVCMSVTCGSVICLSLPDSVCVSDMSVCCVCDIWYVFKRNNNFIYNLFKI